MYGFAYHTRSIVHVVPLDGRPYQTNRSGLHQLVSKQHTNSLKKSKRKEMYNEDEVDYIGG